MDALELVNVRQMTDAHGRAIIVKSIATKIENEPRSTTDDRVRRHAQLLEQARHPGVVELLRIEHHDWPPGSTGGLALVLAPVVGPTLGDVTLEPSHIAGVLSAVANTVAHLHGRKIVHGALVAEHILLEQGSRPRLCGFGAAVAGRDRRPADDVYALALLIRESLGPWRAVDPGELARATKPAPSSRRRTSPRQRGKRPAATERSPLSEATMAERLHLMAGAVLSAPPDKRMSCRVFADELASLPGARLPDAPTATRPSSVDALEDVAAGHATARLRSLAAPHRRRQSAALKSADEGPGPNHVPPFPSDAATAPTSFRAAKDEIGVSNVPIGPIVSSESIELEATRLESDDLTSPTDGDELSPETESSGTGSTRGSRNTLGFAATVLAVVGVAASVYALRVSQAADPTGQRRVQAPISRSPASTSPAPSTLKSQPTVTSRPALERADPATKPPPSNTVKARPAELVTTPSTADAAASWARPATIASTPFVPPESVPPTSVPPGAAQRTVPVCPTDPAAPTLPIGPETLADVDGSGCARPVFVHGNALRVGEVRFTLGEPGDQILVGDWDGDGLVTPAVFRKSSGELFRYDAWPAADTPVTGTRWREYEPDVTVRVRRLPSGIDTIEETR